MSVVDFPLRGNRPSHPGPGWHDMVRLAQWPIGTKVRLRLAPGPDRDRLGEVVTGWRAISRSGSIYYTWDRAARAHVEVRPIAWRLFDDGGGGGGLSSRAVRVRRAA